MLQVATLEEVGGSLNTWKTCRHRKERRAQARIQTWDSAKSYATMLSMLGQKLMTVITSKISYFYSTFLNVIQPLITQPINVIGQMTQLHRNAVS